MTDDIERIIRIVLGMANEGIDAPNAAYRWCERIDEVILNPSSAYEYEEFAWTGPLTALFGLEQNETRARILEQASEQAPAEVDPIDRAYANLMKRIAK
jgi:hypothetical protein